MREKTLGKVSAKLVDTLYKRGRMIFSLKEACNILDYDIDLTKKLLYRMRERNLVVGLKAGKYILVPEGVRGPYIGNWYVAAKEVSNSSEYYISHYSAMAIHNMLTQPLVRVYISSPKRQVPPKGLKDRFKFIYVKSEKIWGIENNWATKTDNIRVSDIERTIIDGLWRPQYSGGITEVAKGIWIKKDEIDTNKLLQYIIKFNKKIVAKRLGYILEIIEKGGNIISDLKNYINKRYDVLDPTLPVKQTFKNNWFLRANINPEEIKSIILT